MRAARFDAARVPALPGKTNAMRRMLAAPIAAMICFAAVEAARAQATGEPDYTGEYVMTGKGFGPEDAAYTSTCSVKPDNTAYAVSCFNVANRHTYTGKGIGQGDTFAIFIGDTLKGDHNRMFAGEYLAVYRRDSAGVLTGVWTHAETPAAGAEILTPKK